MFAEHIVNIDPARALGKRWRTAESCCDNNIDFFASSRLAQRVSELVTLLMELEYLEPIIFSSQCSGREPIVFGQTVNGEVAHPYEMTRVCSADEYLGTHTMACPNHAELASWDVTNFPLETFS